MSPSPTLKVYVKPSDGKVELRFDGVVARRLILSPKTARGLAVRLHLAADKIDPRISGNGTAPHRR